MAMHIDFLEASLGSGLTREKPPPKSSHPLHGVHKKKKQVVPTTLDTSTRLILWD